MRAAAWLCALVATAGVSRAQGVSPAREVDVVERLGERLPGAPEFVDVEGRRVRAGELFADGRPVLLVFAYFRCTTLCSVVLNGLVRGLPDTGLRLGRDYRLVTVSFDPAERLPVARAKRDAYVRALGQGGGPPGAWSFLRGEAPAVRALADGVGLRYATDGDRYVHPAVLVVLTPDGRLSRYLYGVQFAPRDLRLALVEAGAGRVGTVLDRVLLRCYRWDPAARRYVGAVRGVLRGAAAVTLVALAGVVGYFLRRERRRGAGVA